MLLDGLDGDGASVLEGRNDTSLDSLGGVVGSIPHPGVVPDLLDGGTHLRLLGHHHASEISELRRDVLIKLRSLLGEHAEEGTLVLTVEGVAAIQHGVDHDSKAVDVSLGTSVGLATDELGGSITDTAGEVGEDVIRSRDHLGGEPKVDQEDAEGFIKALSTLDEDVFELDVTVAVALLVGVINGEEDLSKDGLGLLLREGGLGLDTAVEIAASHELEEEVDVVFILVGKEELEDVLLGELSEDDGLVDDIVTHRLGDLFLVDDLDGDLATRGDVGAEHDAGKGSLAEALFVDLKVREAEGADARRGASRGRGGGEVEPVVVGRSADVIKVEGLAGCFYRLVHGLAGCFVLVGGSGREGRADDVAGGGDRTADVKVLLGFG